MKYKGAIADMLRGQRGKYISFHTPGHKRRGSDITELDYSDNLSSPHGAIARAQADIALILGAHSSFILTDGSTSGVYSMLYALKRAGVKKIAVPIYSHRCVASGCELMGLEVVPIPCGERGGIPQQPLFSEAERALERSDALFLTSPDYYGNLAPLEACARLCKEQGKPLAVDGAHGAHLHFTEDYAGRYARLWVDGVHKSLPALTQGAVVSAADGEWAERLFEGVTAFRTSSPSYPVMASVEHAVKYPRNRKIELAAEQFKARFNAYPNRDWSKIVIPFGEAAYAAQDYLQSRGIYPEFNDGKNLMFYLSPCTKISELKELGRALQKLSPPKFAFETETFADVFKGRGECVYVPVMQAVGKICARSCGAVPPCIPLIAFGERVTEDKALRLSRAKSTFGLDGGKMLVFSEEA